MMVKTDSTSCWLLVRRDTHDGKPEVICMYEDLSRAQLGKVNNPGADLLEIEFWWEDDPAVNQGMMFLAEWVEA